MQADLFGLPSPPANPHPSYVRLSRYDEIGLIWLLYGRPVIALTEATATIQNQENAVEGSGSAKNGPGARVVSATS